MAENLRDDDPTNSGARMKDALIAELAKEEENALYTSTFFYIWLRILKTIRAGL